MVTFCKFSQKYFIRTVFSDFQPLTICHQFTPPGSTAAPARLNPAPTASTAAPVRLNQTPAASTPARQFQPPLFPPRPNGNAKKNYKPTQLSRFRTRIARGRARSTCASAHARRNIRAARSGCARPRRRVYNIAAWLASCCWAGDSARSCTACANCTVALRSALCNSPNCTP